MELVKRLEGSDCEEEHNNFHFEEQYLHEEENSYAKKIFLSILGLITIGTIGYFGFKLFKEDKNQDLKVQSIAATKSSNTIAKKEIKKEEIISPKKVAVTVPTKPIIQKTLPTPTTVVRVEAPKKKEPVAVYTEVLALEHKAKEVVEKKPIEKKEIITSISLPIKNIIPKKENIKVPKLTKVTLSTNPIIEKKKAKNIRIKKGDTLTILAKRHYGNPLAFQGIINANRSIKSPKTKLKLGQKVFIPIHGKVQTKKIVTKKIKKVQEVVKRTKTIKIKKGDTLAILAKRHYGNSMDFKQIINANKNIKSHKSSLKIGQKIIIPYLSKRHTKKSTKKVKQKTRFVRVKKGYSLAYMAKKFYGSTSKVQKIINANRNIKNKNSTLRIGQKVYLPK
jgi:nucleoid-associated protein YgaU